MTLIMTLLGLFSFGATAQPRADDPIVLIVPANTVAVTNTPVTFEWEETMAAEYKFKLLNADGSQSIGLLVDDICSLNVCSFVFDPLAQDWTWIEGARYKWQVKALDGIGAVVAKSEKFKFTVDMIPVSNLIEPAHNAVQNESPYVAFAWTIDVRVAESRIVIVKTDGAKVHTTDWLASGAYCSSTACTYAVDMVALGLPDRKYKWWVETRGVGVSKIKSAKRSFRLDMGA